MKHIGRRIILVAVPLLGSSLHAQTVSSVQAEVLVASDSSWNGAKYQSYPQGQPQLTVQKLTIPPREPLPWHSHPMPNAVYVVSGQVTIEDKFGGKTQTFKAGQAFTELVGVHRGIAGDDPAVLIITYAGVSGVPTVEPYTGD